MGAPYDQPYAISAAQTTCVGRRTSGATAAGVDPPPIPPSLVPTLVVREVSLASAASTWCSALAPAATEVSTSATRTGKGNLFFYPVLSPGK